MLVARVSTADKGQDPQTQLIALRQAAERQGWIVAEEVALKISGWDDKAAAEVRRRALAPIREGRADVLMVWALDRVTRQGIEAALGLLRELEDHLGGAFYSAQEPFLSTAANNGPTRQLILSLLAWVAQQESDRRSERMKAKVSAKRNRAAALGQRATWGGGAKGGHGGKLASADDMDRARRLQAEGESVRAIASALGLSKSQVGRLLADR